MHLVCFIMFIVHFACECHAVALFSFVRLFCNALEKYHRKRNSLKIAYLFFPHLSNGKSVHRSSDCSVAFETNRKYQRCGIARISFHFMLNLPLNKSQCSGVGVLLKLNRKRSIGRRDQEEGINGENQKSVEPFGQVASKWQWIPYIGNGTTHTSNPFVQQSNYGAVCATTNELLM